MNARKQERVMIFIDGSNFYHSTKNVIEQRHEVNIREIIKELARNRDCKTFYYTALLDKDYNPEKYEKHKEFIDGIKKISNFNVVLCDLRKLKIKKDIFRYEIKGDDVYLAHDLLVGAFDDLYDTAIIVSGDADFIPVIKTLRERFNKKVGNAYFRRTSSFKLRRSCDFSVNMNMVIGKLIEKRKKAIGAIRR